MPGLSPEKDGLEAHGKALSPDFEPVSAVFRGGQRDRLQAVPVPSGRSVQLATPASRTGAAPQQW